QMGQRLNSLDALAKAAALRPDERLRDEAIAALALPDVSFSTSFKASWAGKPIHSIQFDSTYGRYAMLDPEGVIHVHDTRDGRLIRRFPALPLRGANHGLLISPDGELVLRADGGGTLRVWRVADGSMVLANVPHYSNGSCGFSTDSRTLAVDVEGFLVLFDMAIGRETRRWRIPGQLHGVAFDQDSRRLAVGWRQSAS